MTRKHKAEPEAYDEGDNKFYDENDDTDNRF